MHIPRYLVVRLQLTVVLVAVNIQIINLFYCRLNSCDLLRINDVQLILLVELIGVVVAALLLRDEIERALVAVEVGQLAAVAGGHDIGPTGLAVHDGGHELVDALRLLLLHEGVALGLPGGGGALGLLAELRLLLDS